MREGTAVRQSSGTAQRAPTGSGFALTVGTIRSGIPFFSQECGKCLLILLEARCNQLAVDLVFAPGFGRQIKVKLPGISSGHGRGCRVGGQPGIHACPAGIEAGGAECSIALRFEAGDACRQRRLAFGDGWQLINVSGYERTPLAGDDGNETFQVRNRLFQERVDCSQGDELFRGSAGLSPTGRAHHQSGGWQFFRHRS